MEISAVVLTLNEEENIEGCLSTIQWCDEIIVVDSYSEDKTVEIAREKGAKVYQKDSTDGFDGLRQFGVEKASGDWILRLDADERVRSPLADKLQELKESEFDIVKAPRRNYFLGESRDSTWPDYVNIMFRVEAANYSDNIHNFLNIQKGASTYRVNAKKKYAIEHFSYFGVEDRLNRINRYTSIEADQKADFRYYNLFYRPLRRFLGSFVRRREFLKGSRGFLMSSLDSLYVFVEELKKLEKDKIGGSGLYSKRYEAIEREILQEYGGEK